jgi:Kef-type K+ transport system membrane component KefB
VPVSPSEIARTLLIDLAIIVIVARLAGSLAARLGQPRVIGEILAGVLLGPTVLGRLNPDWPTTLFPPEVPLRTIADLGLVFFMLLVGLDLDTTLLRREGRRAVPISLSGILLPLAGGLLLGAFLHPVNAGGTFRPGTTPPDALAFALFLGAALCVTAFPVLARLLVDTGLHRTALGVTSLCAAAVDDVCAWLLLATVVGLTTSGDTTAALRALLLTLLFAVFLLTLGRWLLTRLVTRLARPDDRNLDLIAILLGGGLLSAAVTEWIGVHAVFGAFLFGVCLPRHPAVTASVKATIEPVTLLVLLPVFFLVAGLRTDLLVLNEAALLGWLLLILGVAIGGKFLGCAGAARLAGATTQDALIIGTLMNTRGLVELVVLDIGLSLGVLSDRTYAMLLVMALVTTGMAAPIVAWLRRQPAPAAVGGMAELRQQGP